MDLVRVWTDVGARKPVALLAKIVERDGVIFTIRYLSESDDKIWRYEEDTYEIDDDSIAEHLGTSNEEDIGFRPYEDGFTKMDSDEDYVPSSEDEETTDDDDEEEDIDDDEDIESDDESEAESEESIGEE
ncbi:hypothetical protein [Yellowstone lake phycodnavirus 3]|jgi:hypothetical protein|uniref:hypothetical protein n=1 Tax=Yellowstone lake phycodnavirus 3 TaxID=1586715 RepID=UPI0006EB9B74|nr:hypothetical protein AR677_gp201 [Yellowstone lake phycodnavirus 3]BAT22700.1 hypothetical protein [Yellowstone lake phycodnavirus 3]